MVIDATLHRSWASMVNHSNDSCNVVPEWIQIPRTAAGGKTKVVYNEIIPPSTSVSHGKSFIFW